VVLKTRWSI